MRHLKSFHQIFGILIFITALTRSTAVLATAPTATAFSTSTNEDTTLTVDLTPYASDADGDTLKFYKYTAYKGTVSITTAGMATFKPTANYYGADAYFYFYAKDASTSSSKVKVSITVSAVNDAPVSKAVSASTSEDVAKSISFSATDAESSSTALTYSVVTSPTKGTLAAVSGKTVKYTPTANFNGTDSFTYKVTDDKGAVSNTSTVSLTINAVNDKPTAASFSKTLGEDEAIEIDLKPYVTDLEDNAVTYYKSYEYKGTVMVDSTTGIAKFTPTANYYGTAGYITYYAVDSAGGTSSKGKVSFTINAVNDAPVATSAAVSVPEDTTDMIFTLVATDAESDAITFKIAGAPTHGTASLSSRTVSYIPEANFNGTDTVTFQAYETALPSSISAEAIVTVTVEARNDAPKAEDTVLSTDKNKAVALILNASDIDGDTLTYSFSTPSHGSVIGSGSTYAYTPTTDFSGSDAFTYTVSDGILTATANVTVMIVASANAPVAAAQSVSTDEDTSTMITLTATDTKGDPITYAIATSTTNGTLTLSDNVANYTPTEDFNGSDSFTFTASDGILTSDPATVTIKVKTVNDRPVAADVTASTNENTAVAVTLDAKDDADNDALLYHYLSSDHGDVAIQGKMLTFTPDTGFSGTALVYYQASDAKQASNTATVTITVNSDTNDAPVSKNLTNTLSEDHEKSITLKANDPEGDALTYAVAVSPAHGSVTVSGDAVVYTPDADFYGADSFTYTASDGSNTSAAATVTLTVRALPDPVVACDLTLDPSHLQTDADSGLKYWDNLVEVVMDAPATAAQLTELTSTAGGTGNVCKIELTAMSADEQSHLATGTDTSDLDFAEYRFEIATQTNLDNVSAIATSLSALGYVTYARAAYVYDNPVSAAETDAENRGAVDNMAMPDFFHDIQLEGALEYLAAYDDQGNTLASIALAIGDTGVCASYGYASWCNNPPYAIQAEFTNVKDGINLFGELASTASQTSNMPLGLIDPSENLHGTNVAALMASESNGGSGPTDSGAFTNDVWSGIVGSMPDLDFTLTSYMINSWDKYTWKSMNAQSMYFSYIAATCGDDAVNSSFGRSVYADWKKARDAGQTVNELSSDQAAQSLAQSCNTLYVWAAGNDGQNLDSNADYADHQYYTYDTDDNSIGVAATAMDSITITSFSEHGSGITIAAPGEGGTSYAAPLVTGTAGLLKAVDPTLSPTDLVKLLEVSEETADGTPFLDTAASVLMAIEGKDDDYVPMTLQYAKYEYLEDLATLRTDDGYTEGDHNEDGYWRLDDEVLTTERESTEMSDAVPDDKFEDLAKKVQMLSELKSTQLFHLGLVKTTDTATGKTAPFLAALPQGEQDFELNGKFRFVVDIGDNEYYDRAAAYGFKLAGKYNDGEEVSDKAFLVPLANNGEKSSYEVPFKFSEIQLTGYLTEEFVKVDVEDLANTAAADYEGLEPLDPTKDIMPKDEDNTAAFDEWSESAKSITFESYSAPADDPARAEDCTDYEAHCNVGVQDDTYKGYYKFDITFDDTECSLSMASTAQKLYAFQDISFEETYYQSFGYDLADNGSATCTVTAHIEITAIHQATYYSHGQIHYCSGVYIDAGECSGDPMIHTSKNTYTTDQEVTFEFKDGAFPVKEVFEALQQAFTDDESATSDQVPDIMRGGDKTYAYRLVPDIVLNSGNFTPGFGSEIESYYWSHGIGPMQPNKTTKKKWELKEFKKLDRSVP